MSKVGISPSSTLEEVKKAAIQKIDELKPQAIELLQAMIRIPSPNPGGTEKAMADHNAAYLRQRGFEVEQIEPVKDRPSNVARLRGAKNGARTLLFNSHLDTVAHGDPKDWAHPMLGAEIHDGAIWGVGAKNMKSGMASAMFVGNVLKELGVKLEGDLLLSQTADEMLGGFIGLGEVVKRKMLKADYGIYTETGIPPRIEIGHRGRVYVEMTVKGVTAHTSEPSARKPINAVVKMAKVIEAVTTMSFTHWEPHPFLEGKPICSVNHIHGGFSEIMIPDECVIRMDVRTLPPMTPDTVLEDVRGVLAKLQAADPELQVTAKVVYQAPYSFIDANHPIVQEVQKAVVEVTGSPMKVLASPATSDSRWLVLEAKIPTCKFSFTTVGSGVNERITVDSFINMIKVYTTVTLNTLYRV